jgi:hypothetical protein
MTDATYRGSRKHILDWVESPGFLADLAEMLKPVKVVIPTPAVFMPRGRHAPEEVRLDAGGSSITAPQTLRTGIWPSPPRSRAEQDWCWSKPRQTFLN